MNSCATAADGTIARPTLPDIQDRRGKLPPFLKGKTRDKVAASTGMSGRTLEKATAVVEAAEKEPEKFGPLVEEMDRTGRVSGKI